MPPSQPILLRAPNGEVAWTLIELQGAIESRNGAASLDGIEFGKLTEQVRRASFYSLSLPSLIRTRAMCPQFRHCNDMVTARGLAFEELMMMLDLYGEEHK